MRLAGQAEMGYYPTPDVVAQRIGHALTRAGAGVIRTLDRWIDRHRERLPRLFGEGGDE
jgi:hypothetical protein